MNQIELQDNTNYFYVETHKDTQEIDISIFLENEWNELLNISKKFEEAVNHSISDSDYNYSCMTNKEKSAIYFLYYCNYCKYSGFTTNEFRKWIIDNYETIYENYKLLV